MKLRDIAEMLEAKILSGDDEHLEMDIQTAASSDLMSDILARLGTPDLMLTGLATPQAIRTSSVAGIKCVVVVRGKPITDQMIELARDDEIALFVSKMNLFEASGLLWETGIRSERDDN